MIIEHINRPALTRSANAQTDRELDVLLRLLAVRKRRELLVLLQDESRNVGEIASILGYVTPDVSKHLAELELGGLISTRQHKKQRIKSLTADVTIEIRPADRMLHLEVRSPGGGRVVIEQPLLDRP